MGAQLAASATVNVAAAGLNAATSPVRDGIRIINRELTVVVTGRRCTSDDGRAWIEVRGLSGTGGRQLGRQVLDAVRAVPGVSAAALNFPLSRVVIESEDVPLRSLCDVISNAEKAFRASGGARGPKPVDLPGDGVLMAQRAAAVAANAAGLGVAAAGRALVWARIPGSIAGAVMVVDYQPKVRRLLENQLGQNTADMVLALATAAVNTITLAPPSLAVDLATHTLRAAEASAGARVWARQEPTLSRHASCETLHDNVRAVPLPDGLVERHAIRTAWVQALGGVALGAATQNPAMAGTAAMVATPKAARTARESFAATLGRGLAESHGALAIRPDRLRLLDRIDALVLDPRALCTDKLRLVNIRGIAERDRTDAWEFVLQRVGKNGLEPGWQRIDGARYNGAEALLQHAHHPLASAVVAEARRSGLTVVSVDDSALGELRPALDEMMPLDGDVDSALTDAVTALQQAGKTVALVSSVAEQALSLADLGLGIMPPDDQGSPAWYADMLFEDLSGVWQLLHAAPAARAASRRGVEIATGATALGSLLMLPGVRGVGPGAVTAGAATGVFTGYWLARGSLGAQVPEPAAVHEWHAMSPEQVSQVLPRPDTADLLSPQDTGLMVSAAGLVRQGANIAMSPGRTAWQFARAVRSELADPLTPVLAGGATASAVLGSPVDAAMVGSVVGANAFLAAFQRMHAERLLDQLLAEQVPPARVLAGESGSGVTIDAADLRPGDVVEVRADEVVPADCRLIEVSDLEVDESTLTGESLPVAKQTAATPGAELAERRCMIYAGTTVMTGTAIGIVTAVGAETQARRAAALVTDTSHSVGLQYQLGQLTNKAWPVSLIGGGLVSGLGLLRGTGIREAVASGVAVGVAAVPEGLPLVATLAQQASARRLTKSSVLVRTPRSVEALGRVDVICFDKTGTLSQNKLRVAQVIPAPRIDRARVLATAVRATPLAQDGKHAHATDAAIVESAREATDTETLTEPMAHLPFRPGRPFSASVADGELTVKGAPEVILAACGKHRANAERAVTRMASDGLRVIAVARRTLTAEQIQAVREDSDNIAELCGSGMDFLGLLGLSDTPREDAADLLKELIRQDLSVRLITGDHPITAAAIATELGMPVGPDQVMCGAEWEALSRKGQEEAVADRVVFARMSPEHKVQIVQTLERIGRVCAMVGDGANDAAAIRAATVGVGVVARGSDPAHMAADVVLVDGRISSLLEAIDEGRQLWRRVQAAVSVLLGGNAGEVLFAIVGSALTGRSPLNARQLLVVNMLTDALPAAALAVSKPSKSAPGGGRGIDQGELWRTVGVRGGVTASAATAAWVMARFTGRRQRASTVALVALVATQLGQTLLDSQDWLVVLTALGSVGAMGVLISTPGVSQALGCTPLGPVGWIQGLGTAGVATAIAGAAPELIGRWTKELTPSADVQEPVEQEDQSTMSTKPARNNTAYNSRNGSVRIRAIPVTGSVAKPSVLDTKLTVTVGSDGEGNR